MAANGARIMTGKRIQPTLSMTKPASCDQSMPMPVGDTTWRKAHILDPLMQITTLPGGQALRARFEPKYKLAMKTGTIDDGAGRESEMLMFTFGQFANGAFVPGHSVSGFLSIRSAKDATGDEMVKGDLAKRIMPILAKYLDRQKAQ